jgi:adenylosuccinate synthase
MGVKGEERKNNLTEIIERSGERIPKRRTKRSRKGVTERRKGSKITDRGKLRRDKIRFPKPEDDDEFYDFLHDNPNAHEDLVRRNPSETQLTDMLDDLENDYEDIIEEIKALDESINRLRNLPERKELHKKRLKEDEDMREMLPNSKNAILSEMGFILSYVKIHNENQKRKINIVFSPKIEADDNVLLLESKLKNERLFEKAFAQFKNN